MTMDTKTDCSDNLSATAGSELTTIDILPKDPLSIYGKCITCPDLGISCKGINLALLQTISNVREHHRRLRNCRNIYMKQIFALTENEISNASVKDYFSHEEKDFRWTTVALIDNALTAICGAAAGVMPDDVSPCPATASDMREQQLKFTGQLQAAEEKCLELQASIAENERIHAERLSAAQSAQQERVEWLREDLKRWRCAAFILIGITAAVIAALMAYIVLAG